MSDLPGSTDGGDLLMIRWRDRTFDWKRRYAFLPICIGGECRQFCWYWERFEGDCYSVAWEPPK